MQKLNIIGCGRLGRTLAKLWSASDTVAIGGICNRTLQSGEDACKFIGSGIAVANIQQLPAADLWLIATPDADIENCAQILATDNHALATGNIVFHCSGSLSANVLASLGNRGLQTASVHPVHSFADPLKSQQSFAGTFCALEGKAEAMATLATLFSAIGGKTFTLDTSSQNTSKKALYHAATAVASNYLVTLLNTALDMLQQAGVDRSQARDLLMPIVSQTTANVGQSDCVEALTGPIARGDYNTIKRHIEALEDASPQLLALYKLLGEQTLPLASKQGVASQQQLKEIEKLLKEQANT